MKRFLGIVLLLSLVCPASAQESRDFALPKNLSLVLPADGTVQAEWMAPPLAESLVKKSAAGSPKFRMHPKGAVWVLFGEKTIADLASGIMVSLARPVRDFVFLKDGNLLVAGDKSLGFIPPLDPKITPKDAGTLPYQPILPLPCEKCSLFSDGKDVFVFGYEPGEKTYAVFELTQGFSGWHRIFVSAERITAACADAGTLFVACGRQVFRMRPGEKEGKVVFSHPLETVNGLAWQGDTGLFYSTNSGVGLVAGAGLEFIKCTAAQIISRDKALYVFLPDSLGVLRLRDIERLVRGQTKK